MGRNLAQCDRFNCCGLGQSAHPGKISLGPGRVTREDLRARHHNRQGGGLDARLLEIRQLLPKEFHTGFHHGRIVENPLVTGEFMQGFGQPQGRRGKAGGSTWPP